MKLTYWTAPILKTKSLEKSIEEVCQHFNVELEKIKEHSRKRIYSDPRAIICYLLRTEHHWTWEKVGGFFNRDHATGLHHSNRVAGLMEVDKQYRELVNSFK
tara:strand:- start:1329 stop:1634 length:306 start_codon:yes stop_codon:yes gene_type:complete